MASPEELILWKLEEIFLDGLPSDSLAPRPPSDTNDGSRAEWPRWWRRSLLWLTHTFSKRSPCSCTAAVMPNYISSENDAGILNASNRVYKCWIRYRRVRESLWRSVLVFSYHLSAHLHFTETTRVTRWPTHTYIVPDLYCARAAGDRDERETRRLSLELHPSPKKMEPRPPKLLMELANNWAILFLSHLCWQYLPLESPTSETARLPHIGIGSPLRIVWYARSGIAIRKENMLTQRLWWRRWIDLRGGFVIHQWLCRKRRCCCSMTRHNAASDMARVDFQSFACSCSTHNTVQGIRRVKILQRVICRATSYWQSVQRIGDGSMLLWFQPFPQHSRAC